MRLAGFNHVKWTTNEIESDFVPSHLGGMRTWAALHKQLKTAIASDPPPAHTHMTVQVLGLSEQSHT